MARYDTTTNPAGPSLFTRSAGLFLWQTFLTESSNRRPARSFTYCSFSGLGRWLPRYTITKSPASVS